jgi:RNA methyltransferase, TrmH family
MPKITSRDNPKIKFARQVRTGRANFIFIEGARLAEEVLKSALPIHEVLFTEDFAAAARGQEFLNSVKTKSESLVEVSDKIFASLADTKTSQGVIVVAGKPAGGKLAIETNLNLKKESFPPLVVLLHRINNPNNLGAILRTAEAVGAAGVVLTKNSADAFSPKATRGAMGASFRLPLWTNADFAEALSWAREKNLKSVCADVNAEKIYTEIDWKRARLVVFGSEAHGLSAEERAQIDESLLIPMANNVESLNIAVACGIVLYEARRK